MSKPEFMRTEIDGKRYLIRRLTPREQTHIGRRIAPLVTTLGISLHTFVAGQRLSVDEILPSVGPLSVMLAQMSDDDVDYVIFGALSVCSRIEDAGGKEAFAPMVVDGRMMYADLDLLPMWKLIFESIRFSMSDFLMELLGGGRPKSS